ncbi:glycosyltransferase family 4 protein [Angustibacter luteus]|uniref:Glycosyltransferase family 4 protein n=1 Tax=Angustibacter luteus TaxID=658456 RepID=A0ABW1JJ39_9ACTN
MRILHLTFEYPPFVHGGLGRYVHGLARAQAAAGHDVTVIAPGADLFASPGPGSAADEETAEGVRVLRVPVPKRLPGPIAPEAKNEVLDAVGALAGELLHLALRQQADVVHAHDWMTGSSGRGAAHAMAVPMVLTVHATERGRRFGRLDTALARAIDETERTAVHVADAVTVCSAAMVDEVAHLGRDPRDLTVVPGAVDAPAWRVDPEVRAVARQRFSPDRSLLVAAGRLEWEKGFSTLLRAVPGLTRAAGPVRVVLAGAGSYQPTLVALGDEVGADVLFAGRLDPPQLAALLAAADAVVVPSRYEPFGLIALEAQASGAAVVATAVGGLADTVQDAVTGRSFAPGDVDHLAAILGDLLADPLGTQGLAAAGQLAAAERTWERVARCVESVYRGAGRPTS